jgi:hypothetical protein
MDDLSMTYNGSVTYGPQSGQVIHPGQTEIIPFSAQPQDAEKIEILRLRSKHDLFDIFLPDWRVYVLAYEGGSSICTSEFVYRHQRENDLDFQDRVRRLHYHNYCDVLVDFFKNFIYAETIQRNGGSNDDWYQKFLMNVDGKGNDITTWMKQWETFREVYGMVYTLVDEPLVRNPDALLTKADEEQLDLNPYWVLIPPNEVTDWFRDDFDKLQYLKRKQLIDMMVGRSKRKIERYAEFYPDQIVTSEIDVTDREKPRLLPKEILPNTLGYIPIHCEVFKESLQYPGMGNSFLRDLAKNNIEVLNLTSLNQEFLYRQCFNVLARETATSLPYMDQEDSVISQSNVIDVPKGAAMPQYISPPSQPAEYIAAERTRIVNEMFRRAAQDTLNELFNGEGKSGFSQAQSFSKSVPFIATRADVCERSENLLMEITLDRLTKAWDGKIKYKDRYELTNITDMITQFTSLARDLQLPSETFVKEELKRVVAEFDGQLPPDVKKKVENEIDAIDWKDWMETQKEALVGTTPGNSPAAQQGSKSSGTMAEVAKESGKKPGAATKKIKK